MSEKSNSNMVKASFFYIMSSFLLRGISFITTPFFSRILTQNEYGYISNFNSWLSIFIIVTSLSLISSLIRARFDYCEDYNSYVSSILILGLVFTFFCFTAIFINYDFFKNALGLDKRYIALIALCSIAQPAYDIFFQNQRFNYKYKLISAMSIIVTLIGVGLSFLFVNICDDKSWGMVLGTQLPVIIVGITIYVYYWKKTLKFKLKYCKYALVICIPYIFHLLSSIILSSSDRVMITRICGTKDNAVYSMAYNIGMIVNVVWMALNQAFSPWVGEKLNEKKYSQIRDVSTLYTIMFCIIVIGLLLIAPETLMILGGRKYADSLDVIPIVMLSYVIVFVDSLYVNVLQYEKHTFGMACATIVAAVMNVILNYKLIPLFGYRAAAYTTLFSYLILFIMDFELVRIKKFVRVYNSKLIVKILMIMICLSFIMLIVYKYIIARCVMLIIYILFICKKIYKYKDNIKYIRN